MDANITQNPASLTATSSAIQKLQSIYKEQISDTSSQEQLNEEARPQPGT